MTVARSTVRPFDFTQSHRLAADQLRSLERIFAHWASLLVTYLTAYLRCPVSCTPKDMAQSVFGDILGELSQSSVVATLGLEPLPGSALLRLDGAVAHALIDRLLGGSGDVTPMERSLTEIDAEVLRRGLPVVCDALSEAWSAVDKIHCQVRDIELSPQFLRITSPQESVMEAAFHIAFAGVEGDITLLLPYDLLKPELPHLSSVALLQEADLARPTDAEGARRLRSLVMGARVRVEVVLGEASVSVREFLHLGPGDVIVLDQKVSQPMRVEVEGRPKFHGHPRSQGRRLQVLITGVLSDGKEGV